MFPKLKVSLQNYNLVPRRDQFTIELYCGEGDVCGIDEDFGDDLYPATLESIDPPFCTNNSPDWIVGYDPEDVTERFNRNWNVPYRFYRLGRVRLWRYQDTTTGFRLIYFPPDSFRGWPKISRTFGSTAGDIYEQVALDKDL